MSPEIHGDNAAMGGECRHHLPGGRLVDAVGEPVRDHPSRASGRSAVVQTGEHFPVVGRAAEPDALFRGPHHVAVANVVTYPDLRWWVASQAPEHDMLS